MPSSSPSPPINGTAKHCHNNGHHHSCSFPIPPFFVSSQGVAAVDLELEIIGTTSAMCKYAMKRGIDLTPILD
jgi:hypothetical protein